MALNTVFASTDSRREVWTVASEIPSGTPLLNGTVAGVALTASGGSTKSVTVGPYSVSGIPNGGIGLKALEVSVATDGTFEFTGVKATDGTAAAPTTTAQGALVYITSGGVLSLQSTSNTLFGRVNYPDGAHKYVKVAGKLPVRIGS